MNKYKLCKHRANLGIKIHFITTLTKSNKEDVEIYNTDRKDNIIIKFRLPIKVHIIHHTLPNGWILKVAASGEPDLNYCFWDSNGGTEHRTFDILQEN